MIVKNYCPICNKKLLNVSGYHEDFKFFECPEKCEKETHFASYVRKSISVYSETAYIPPYEIVNYYLNDEVSCYLYKKIKLFNYFSTRIQIFRFDYPIKIDDKLTISKIENYIIFI